MRTDINALLSKPHAPKLNLTKEEYKALVELKMDKDGTILTADKSVDMVVLDKKEYLEKVQELLSQPAYRTIERDLTNKLRAKLITILGKIKRGTGMDEKIHKAMFPTGCTPPKFYGLPKIHKTGTPRPIVLSRCSVTYGLAKVLAKIVKPLVGKAPHHIQNTKDVITKISKVTLLLGECLCSYYVLALFTSVLTDPTLNIIKELLEQDTSLQDRTLL